MTSNYNKLVFPGSIRSRLKNMRFHWLRGKLAQEGASENSFTLFELGCFDCRSLEHIPKPAKYLGADAGWEGGINDAQMTYVNKPWVELVVAQSVHDLAPFETRQYDYAVALETLEHIPDAVLSGYIAFLSKITKKTLFITVPVEVGPVFLAKHLAKRTFSNLQNDETDSYRWREVYWAARGDVSKVARYEHKGFDYRLLIDTLSRYFTITAVEGLPFQNHPHYSFQVGIIAAPKTKLAATSGGQPVAIEKV